MGRNGEWGDLIDIFAFQHAEEGVEALFVGFDANGGKKSGDIFLGWMGVGKLNEEICCEVFHLDLSTIFGKEMYDCRDEKLSRNKVN